MWPVSAGIGHPFRRARRVICEFFQQFLIAPLTTRAPARVENDLTAMTGRETRRYEMLARVQHFGTTHRGRFPESTVGGRAFATVAAAVARLRAYAEARMSISRQSAVAKSVAR